MAIIFARHQVYAQGIVNANSEFAAKQYSYLVFGIKLIDLNKTST
ncbi:hypothetical protein [Nostoc sp. PA-18-2419]|nr:hypothetical protein [Nostoc sp. PA-18-2419]